MSASGAHDIPFHRAVSCCVFADAVGNLPSACLACIMVIVITFQAYRSITQLALTMAEGLLLGPATPRGFSRHGQSERTSIALPPPAFVIYRSLPRQGEGWRTCMRSCGLDAVHPQCSAAAEGKQYDQHEAALLLSSQECLQFLRANPTGAPSISNVSLSHTPSRANKTA